MQNTHRLADHKKQPNKRTISRHNQKTDTTAQLYCTLSTYVTPKTIFHQNQKTNTMPLLEEIARACPDTRIRPSFTLVLTGPCGRIGGFLGVTAFY